jgi:hypothetical protein
MYFNKWYCTSCKKAFWKAFSVHTPKCKHCQASRFYVYLLESARRIYANTKKEEK